MKRILWKIGAGVIVLLIIAILAVSFFLDGAVKRAVETIGPRLTKTDIKLDAVNLSLLSGSGRIKGLIVGNPEGFKTPHAMSVQTASLSLKPGSLLSDKIVVRSIVLEGPEITFEAGLGGNNLGKLRANAEESGGSAAAQPAPSGNKPAGNKPGKKLEVDEFLITGAKLNVSVTGMRGQAVPVVLPPIHLSGLGTGPDGITAAELTRQVLAAIEQAAAKEAGSALEGLGKGAGGLTKDLGNGAQGIGKSLGDLFKKKN